MNDDQIRFVGVFQGTGQSHGPVYKSPTGIEYSCRYAGTGTYAVDDRGCIWALAGDLSSNNAMSQLVWVRMKARLVRDPSEE